MLINLLEIPEDGKVFICNRNTKDLNEALRDLIGDQAYQTEFSIRPLQPGTYELKGWIKTRLPEDCSRCGIDFDFDVSETFQELLIPLQKMDRTAKYAKTNHVSDMSTTELSSFEYKGHHFDAGQYLHEVVGLAEPFIPSPACDAQGNCSLCKKPVTAGGFKFEEPGFEGPAMPFEALKNIKLN